LVLGLVPLRRKVKDIKLTVFLMVIMATAFGIASADEAVSSGGDVVIWHIPHADDETLGMAGAISSSVKEGNTNIVLLYTAGGASGVRLVINGLIYCRYHNRWHQPAEEGYEPLNEEAFKQARIRETINALEVLGVKRENIFFMDIPDGSLTVKAAYAIIKAYDLKFPQAKHRTTSLYDSHTDHRNLARALLIFSEEEKASGRDVDVAFYKVYHYNLPEVERQATAVRVLVEDKEKKMEALNVFTYWAPEEERFSVGIHSVPRLFAGAFSDPYEYMDLIPDRLSGFDLRKYDLSMDITWMGLAVNYGYDANWVVRVSASRPGYLVSTLIFQSRVYSPGIRGYAGVGVNFPAINRRVNFLAGLEIIRQLILEYQILDGNGHWRLGYRYHF
jgi:LmbE family N-acetylglucosaminyl deacetylase